MVKNFEDLQQVGKENVDIALKSMGALSQARDLYDACTGSNGVLQWVRRRW